MESARRSLWLTLTLVLLLAAWGEAQESRGSISGRVVDHKGASLPGATVERGERRAPTPPPRSPRNTTGGYTALLPGARHLPRRPPS